MSFAVTAVVAAAATVYTAYESGVAAREQKKANNEAIENAKKQADMADQQQNRANARRPDFAGISAGNAASLAGNGTMLTGPQGVDPNKLLLGKSTLLGG